MKARNGGQAGEGLPVICPSCDELLTFDGGTEIEEGETIRTFCPDCTRTVEVTAPSGIEEFSGDDAERVEEATITEFVAGSAREQG